VQVAQGADAVVLALGGSTAPSRAAKSEHSRADAPSVEQIGAENELARALFALGEPVVVVLVKGRPRTVAAIGARAKTRLEGG
jgi:beta-glucosidase